MQRIKLEQSAPGMALARPVETQNGQVLCAKGTKLTEELIARLERLEISHITVEGRPVDDGRPEKTLDEELTEIEERFSNVANNKLMTALKAVIIKHVQERHQRIAEDEAAQQTEGDGEGENPAEELSEAKGETP